MRIRILAYLLMLMAVPFGLASCSTQHSVYQPFEHPSNSEQVAADLQAGGIMTQADFMRLDQLRVNANHGMPLSDSDLTWALSLMTKSSKNPQVARSDVMFVFLRMKTIPENQKLQIRQAVTPFLHDGLPLDENFAAKVMRKLQKAPTS